VQCSVALADVQIIRVVFSLCFLLRDVKKVLYDRRFFVFRSDEMAETLTNRFQNLYNKYTRSESAPPRDHHRQDIYIVPLNTVVDQQQQRYRSKSRRTFAFNPKHLCEAKELKWQMLRQKKRRPFVGQHCSVCIPVRLFTIYHIIIQIRVRYLKKKTISS